MILIDALIPLFAADAPGGPAPVNPTGEMLKLGGMVAMFIFVFYFIAIRPQSQKAKQHAAMLKTLRAGDKVVTSGGLLGVVLTVKDKSVSVRSGESKLEFQKGAIAEVLERGSEASPS
jgi:preprotein translocase subunit YajC